jgi:hypothetical protein
MWVGIIFNVLRQAAHAAGWFLDTTEILRGD